MLEDYFFTKNTRWILWGAAALVLALLIFHAGVVVGSHEPMRGRMGPNGAPPQGLLGGFMPGQGFVENGHGAVGTIQSFSYPMLSLQTRDGLVQKINLSSSTVISGRTASGTNSLMQGQTVIVIGDPTANEGQGYLDARIIRILP